MQVTGVQANLSGPQQVLIVLRTCLQLGGSARMADFYAAINEVIQPLQLSANGRAALRCYVNRNAVEKGWIEADTKARHAALWRLTASGRALVAPKGPEAVKSLRVPLLRALGILSGHTTQPVLRKDALERTLTLAGYGCHNLPSEWSAPTSNGRPYIHEALRYLARTMTEHLSSAPPRNHWALTVEGVIEAARCNGVDVPVNLQVVEPKPQNGPNATALWFQENLKSRPGAKSELMQKMRSAIIKHLPLSAQRGMVDDHIQSFITRAIRRDSFARMIEEGETIHYSKVASYCVNSGRSDARDLGTDPVSRELLGARTEKERKNSSPEDAEVSKKPVHQDTDGSLFEDGDGSVEMGVNFEVLWGRLSEVVQKREPKAWAQYETILRLKCEGYSNKEIASQMGMTTMQAAKTIQAARQVVRDTCSPEYLF